MSSRVVRRADERNEAEVPMSSSPNSGNVELPSLISSWQPSEEWQHVAGSETV
jgi:hypothetical protein